jgi:hypothetical protein
VVTEAERIQLIEDIKGPSAQLAEERATGAPQL